MGRPPAAAGHALRSGAPRPTRVRGAAPPARPRAPQRGFGTVARGGCGRSGAPMRLLHTRCHSAVRLWYFPAPRSPRVHPRGSPGRCGANPASPGDVCTVPSAGRHRALFSHRFQPVPAPYTYGLCSCLSLGWERCTSLPRWGEEEPGPPTAHAGLGRVCSTPCQMLMSAGGTALEQQSPRETLGEPRFPPAALGTRLQGRQPSEYPGRFALPGCTLPRSQGGTEQHDVQCWQPLACLSGVICWSSGSLIGRKDWGCKSPSVAAVASKITSSLTNGESSLLRLYSPLDRCMWSAATHSWGAHVAEGTRKSLAGGSRDGFPSAGGPGWCFLKPLFDLGPALQVLHNFRLSRL